MKQAVYDFVRLCDVCERCKGENSFPAGLLQPLPIPQQAWQHIALDFFEELPKSEGKDIISVVVDRFTKYSHFIPLAHPFAAIQVARLFLDNVYKLHGPPESIVSDRDRIFLSHFWQELFKAGRTQLHHTTAYHPQSDGQSERTNSCLEQYLQCMTYHRPTSWTKWISLAVWWFNTNFHTGLNVSPFKALYGYDPPNAELSADISSSVAAVSDHLKHWAAVLDIVKENLQ